MSRKMEMFAAMTRVPKAMGTRVTRYLRDSNEPISFEITGRNSLRACSAQRRA